MNDTQKRRKKSQTGLCPHLKVNSRLLKLSWNSLIGFTIKTKRLIKEIVSVKICINPIKCLYADNVDEITFSICCFYVTILKSAYFDNR